MYFDVGAQFTFIVMKFISDTNWLSLITETYIEVLDAHMAPVPGSAHGNGGTRVARCHGVDDGEQTAVRTGVGFHR
jgi:hypothetical protein